MSVLSLHEVSVSRGARRILHEVSLTMGEAQTVALVGLSGAGKSTVLRVALALEVPKTGFVRWGGVDPYAVRGAALRAARQTLGAVFQQPLSSLDPRFTVGQSLAEPLRTHAPTLSAAACAQSVAAALRDVGLPADYAARWPRTLSGGEAQRVAIARALIAKPAVLLLDEPTSALDPSAAAALINLLKRLTEARGTALLLVSHDLATVGMLAQTTVVLDQGRIVEEGPTDRLYAAPQSAALRRLLAVAQGNSVGHEGQHARP